jgi:sortase A
MRQALRVSGELLFTAGIITLLFVGYLLWGSGMRTAAAQRQFASELNREWGRPATQAATRSPVRQLLAGQPDTIDIAPDRFDVAIGQPFAFITIPAFGPGWRFTLIQGTALAQLNLSPGHVPGTQWPGQVGNFAIAGHRVTSGNPFWSLPALRPGDTVNIQTQRNDYTYRVTGKELVPPTDTAVLDAVPGHPGQQPTRRLITLITCDPAWTGTHRVIVTGVLIAANPR